MDRFLTLLGCVLILLSSMKDPEWLEWTSWVIFFCVACCQNWRHQKRGAKSRLVKILFVYCIVAAAMGYASAGLPQNGNHRAMEWFLTAAGLFTLSFAIIGVGKVVAKGVSTKNF
jgi:hypothetical protein